MTEYRRLKAQYDALVEKKRDAEIARLRSALERAYNWLDGLQEADEIRRVLDDPSYRI